ncbi:MAG: zinc ribbon domain-containing protein [Hungatella sp.]|nr:zinc ribbon domain-containing protein [Hungatella sp.]
MFFICGVNQGQKELSHSQLVICGSCGGYGRYQVFMTYMSLSLFFIPILKWGRQYYVKMSCCGTLYRLDPDIGWRIGRGEQVEITPADLTLVQAGTREAWRPGQGRKMRCGNCGYETEEDFSFCPKCGGRLEER